MDNIIKSENEKCKLMDILLTYSTLKKQYNNATLLWLNDLTNDELHKNVMNTKESIESIIDNYENAYYKYIELYGNPGDEFPANLFY